ncbi:MAG: DUF2568 domain-containing protein [Chloroflexi bacterium]|nr:DUF2568 domain-containing protein [Chloroflexota bacterium]
MSAEIGLAGLALAFFAALLSIPLSVFGARRRDDRLIVSGRNAALLTFPLLLLSSGALLSALLTQQYQIAYVWQVSSPATPDFFRLTALWGSQQGSLLFWCLLMSLFAFVALIVNWNRYRAPDALRERHTMATLAFLSGWFCCLKILLNVSGLRRTSARKTAFLPSC